MTGIFLVLGGSSGAIARYVAGKWLSRFSPYSPFPIAMLIVNMIGSFGLGACFALFHQSSQNSLYLLIGIGFFGAFTTFSTFSVEAFQLFARRKIKPFMQYVLFSFFGSLAFFLVGTACSTFLMSL